MSNIFCTSCGSKHSVGAKFCSSCGSSLSKVLNTANNFETKVNHSENDEFFKKPKRLEYEIQNPNSNNIYEAKQLFHSNPVKESDRLIRESAPERQLTKEEYLNESLKECAPSRNIEEIN